MNCEKCGSRSTVIETRTDRDKVGVNEFGTVYRRRKCANCGDRWSTAEIREDRLNDHDVQTRAEQAEAKLRTAKQAINGLLAQL